MQNMPERWPDLQEALCEAEEELFLLRCVLQCLMEAGEGQAGYLKSTMMRKLNCRPVR